MNNKWIEWVTEMQSIAQAGLTFAQNSYDLDRYEKLRNLSVRIIQEYTGLTHEKLKNLFANETGYQTPKVDIRCAVFREGKILMVREKIDGKWSLPGGWADVNSSVSASAVRECSEEAGAVVEPKRIIAIHYANKHNVFIYPYTVYKIFVECELKEYLFRENLETLGSDFFSRDGLPELSAERNSREQLLMCFDAAERPSFETIFD
jgi:ADP-ribose pyrophosphatase YjhB (NUDIX family)